MDVETADELRQALAHPDITGAAITRQLNQRGFSVGPITVNRHRRGDCSC